MCAVVRCLWLVVLRCCSSLCGVVRCCLLLYAVCMLLFFCSVLFVRCSLWCSVVSCSSSLFPVVVDNWLLWLLSVCCSLLLRFFSSSSIYVVVRRCRLLFGLFFCLKLDGGVWFVGVFCCCLGFKELS